MENKIKILLFAILLFLVVSGIATWLRGENYLSDFGLNFTTEIIGVIITVFIVDYLLKRREENRLLPMRMIIYQEISVLFNRHSSLFFGLYKESVNDPTPESFKEFVEQGCIEKALRYASIYGKPESIPETTIVKYIYSNALDFEKRTESILNKYAAFMPPNISNILHNLFIESMYINTLKHLPQIFKIRNKDPFPKTLLYFLGSPEEKYKTELIRLYNWLIFERQKLIKYDQEIRPITEPAYLNELNNNRQLRYRINEKDLKEQEEKYVAWRSKIENSSD